MSFSSREAIAGFFFQVDVDNTPKELLAGTPTLFAVEIDNSQNSVDVFFKMWSVTPVVIGTTDPDIVIRVAAGTILPVMLPSDGDGIAFSANMFVACVTIGGTVGSVSPPNTVTATVWAS